jgi:site-specific recombinase XerD
VARHTCATAITFMNKMSIETASKLLGHTKLCTTQRNTQRLWKRRLVRIYVPSNRVWEVNH